MQFSRAFRHSLPRDAQRIVDVMSVGVGLARRAKETAELTVDIADVRRIEMTIDVEVRSPSMFPAPHCIGKFTQGVEIICGKESYAVFERKTFAAIDLRPYFVK